MQRKCIACGHVENEFTFFCTECGGKTEEYSDSSLPTIGSEVEFQGNVMEKELKDEVIDEIPLNSKKNPNALKILVGVLAVAILLSILVAGILIRRNAIRQDTEIISPDITTASAENMLEEERKVEKNEEVEDVVEKSNSDSSQVDNILYEAEQVASCGEYDKAIAIINDALAEGLYDEMLVTRLQEYTIENDDDLENTENTESQDDDIDSEDAIIQENIDFDDNREFYGIWCGASKEYAGAEEIADILKASGFEADVFITTDWDNLNTEQWYVVSAGRYYEEEDAEKNLPSIKEVFGNAYIKFTGKHK